MVRKTLGLPACLIPLKQESLSESTIAGTPDLHAPSQIAVQAAWAVGPGTATAAGMYRE